MQFLYQLPKDLTQGESEKSLTQNSNAAVNRLSINTFPLEQKRCLS
jgi:hypothetical protein